MRTKLPFILFATHFGCVAACVACAASLPSLLALALPFTLGATALGGMVLIPSIFIHVNKSRSVGGWMEKFVKRQSGKLGIKSPKIYLLDKTKPVAFSFRTWRSAIFMSVGLSEMLNKKETEAVLLHEIAHIASRASLLKLSAVLMRLSPFSVFRSFNADLGREEKLADGYAISIQRTPRWLNSAKRKIERYKNSQKKTL